MSMCANNVHGTFYTYFLDLEYIVYNIYIYTDIVYTAQCNIYIICVHIRVLADHRGQPASLHCFLLLWVPNPPWLRRSWSFFIRPLALQLLVILRVCRPKSSGHVASTWFHSYKVDGHDTWSPFTSSSCHCCDYCHLLFSCCVVMSPLWISYTVGNFAMIRALIVTLAFFLVLVSLYQQYNYQRDCYYHVLPI